jgi:hypothetical protein
LGAYIGYWIPSACQHFSFWLLAIINGLNNSEGDAEIGKKVASPGWLTPESIHKHFNGQPIDFGD